MKGAGTRAALAALLLAATAGAQVPETRPRRHAPLAAPPAQDTVREDDEEALELSADLVLVSAVVTKAGDEKPLRNLTVADFTVLDEGAPQRIEFFGDETLPLDVVFLVDASDSLKFKQKFQREALAAFLRGLLRSKDRASVAWFNDRTRVEQGFTSDQEALLRAIDRIPQGGATALYDAIVEASSSMGTQTGRRAIVVLSDGRDTFSNTRLDEALRRAQGADVVLFAINTSFPAWSVTPEYRANDPLEFLAEETGGEVFYPGDPEDVERTLRLLSSRLRERYVLGFYPTSTARNGRFRKVTVQVSRKNVEVRARAGYYAPER